MRNPLKLVVANDHWLEACNIADGLFYPLNGFMASADYRSVVENMHLVNGQPWTIPVTLDVPAEKISEINKAEKIILVNKKNEPVVEIIVDDVFKVDYENDIKKVFGTDDAGHPGVAKEVSRSVFRIGGPVKILKKEEELFSGHALTPAETKKIFKQNNWLTVTGFQTRNPIHTAHECLQRKALEITDGLFIQPLIGWKKKGDFTPEAVVKAYEKMIARFFPPHRVQLAMLRTPMRYAGPREAVFHALIRRNFGCTHFVVGRDHAGVGNFYGKYDAHKLCRQFNDLGIKILYLQGPYYCKKCGTVVTEDDCRHGPEQAIPISGTEIRSLLSQGKVPPRELMREEIADVLLALQKKDRLFVEVSDGL